MEPEINSDNLDDLEIKLTPEEQFIEEAAGDIVNPIMNLIEGTNESIDGAMDTIYMREVEDLAPMGVVINHLETSIIHLQEMLQGFNTEMGGKIRRQNAEEMVNGKRKIDLLEGKQQEINVFVAATIENIKGIVKIYKESKKRSGLKRESLKDFFEKSKEALLKKKEYIAEHKKKSEEKYGEMFGKFVRLVKYGAHRLGTDYLGMKETPALRGAGETDKEIESVDCALDLLNEFEKNHSKVAEVEAEEGNTDEELAKMSKEISEYDAPHISTMPTHAEGAKEKDDSDLLRLEREMMGSEEGQATPMNESVEEEDEDTPTPTGGPGPGKM